MRGISLGLIVLVLTSAAIAAPLIVPFDRAYTVGAVGSTTPISTFDIGGSAPVLYLDLPAPMGQYSYGSSNWFAGSGANSLFSVSSSGIFTSEDEYWLTPAPEVWNSYKATGDWHINASYAWWDLVIIYGGGAPVTRATGSATVNFSITSTPVLDSPIRQQFSVVPEPSSIFALLGIACAVSARRRRFHLRQLTR